MSGRELVEQMKEALMASGVYSPEEEALAREGAKWFLERLAGEGWWRREEVPGLIAPALEDLSALRRTFASAAERAVLLYAAQNGYPTAEKVVEELSHRYGLLPPGVGLELKRESAVKGYLVLTDTSGHPLGGLVFEGPRPYSFTPEDWEALKALEGRFRPDLLPQLQGEELRRELERGKEEVERLASALSEAKGPLGYLGVFEKLNPDFKFFVYEMTGGEVTPESLRHLASQMEEWAKEGRFPSGPFQPSLG